MKLAAFALLALLALGSAGTARAATTTTPSGRSLEADVIALVENDHVAAAQEKVRNSGVDGERLLFLSGVLLHAVGDFEKALGFLEQAQKLQPRSASIGLRLAEVYVWKGNTAAARRILEMFPAWSLKLVERPWELLGHRANVLMWLGERVQTEALLLDLLESPGLPGLFRRRFRTQLAELCAWNGDFAGAERLLALVTAEEPGHVDALLLKGQLLEWNGQYRAARDLYSSGLQLHPNQARLAQRLERLSWVP
ncbi:MAG: tetratricopeptide repeat protein [Polyangiaceae bacterium]